MNDNNWNPWGDEPPDGKPSKDMPEGMPKDPHKKGWGCLPVIAVGVSKMLTLVERLR